MAKLEVTCIVQNYDDPRKIDVKVHAHWNRREFVVIEIGDNKYTVSAEQLKKAIDNCTNT